MNYRGNFLQGKYHGYGELLVEGESKPLFKSEIVFPKGKLSDLRQRKTTSDRDDDKENRQLLRSKLDDLKQSMRRAQLQENQAKERPRSRFDEKCSIDDFDLNRMRLAAITIGEAANQAQESL